MKSPAGLSKKLQQAGNAKLLVVVFLGKQIIRAALGKRFTNMSYVFRHYFSFI